MIPQGRFSLSVEGLLLAAVSTGRCNTLGENDIAA
jgi:hypothetical protein